MSTSTDDHQTLRARIRAWFIDRHDEIWGDVAPGQQLTDAEDVEVRRRYGRILYRDGWAGLAWDPQYGGRGWTFRDQLVFAEESVLAGAPDPLNRSGVEFLGRALAYYGSEPQRQRYLPPMLAGEEIWCQGFSEPDAGSDLAGLRTSATATENGWKVSGQKIWTTNGAYADVCFLLARTDTNRSRHSGISAFIVDMHSPGLTVHPITQITGSREFCELFLDDVNVDQTRLIGKEGQGWPIAMTVLGFERSINFIYRQISLSHQLSELLDQVRHESNRIPRQVKDRLVHIYLRTAQLEAAVETQIDALDQGVPPGPNNSATKVFWSETYQELTDAALEIEGLLYNTSNGRWAGEYLRARASTIYSGTGEIQRNIIAERGLGLPR